jgi:hypothetical protein
VKAAVDWIAKTADAPLPDDAAGGLDFTFVAPDDRAEASALRVTDEQGEIWAARFNYRGDKKASRDWITDLFVERQGDGFVRFGAQLNCRCAVDDPGFTHSRPRVVRNVLESLAAEADGESLTNQFEYVAEGDVDGFVALLYAPARRLPVVAISVDNFGGAQVDIDQLANRLSGTAHLRCLTIEPSFALSRAVGKKMSVFNGAIRVYMPGLEQETEDPFEHPLWLAPHAGFNRWAVDQVAARVLPWGFRDNDRTATFWKTGLLRQASARALADKSAGTREEQLKAEIEALKSEKEQLKETAETAEALMYEEARKLLQVQAELAQAKEENIQLKQRQSVSERLEIPSRPLSPKDIEDLFYNKLDLEGSLHIVGTMFPARIAVLDSAIISARRSTDFRHRKKAFELLWTLATDYWEALAAGQGDVTARQRLGAAYAAKEAQGLSTAGRKRRTFTHDSKEILMEKHLKIGVADNRAETLRIHFEWLADDRLIVIGHCGEHLDF